MSRATSSSAFFRFLKLKHSKSVPCQRDAGEESLEEEFIVSRRSDNGANEEQDGKVANNAISGTNTCHR